MNNVVIFMQSRTGSSMIASVFRAHGWVTEADDVRSRNYVTHENQRLKRYLKDKYGSALRRPSPPMENPDQQLIDIVRNEFGDRAWCWKGDLYYHAPWLASFSPTIVYVKREIESAVASAMKGRLFPINRGGVKLSRPECEDELRGFLRDKYQLMDELKAAHGGFVVDASAIMDGEFATLQAAVKGAGGQFRKDIARKVIRR